MPWLPPDWLPAGTGPTSGPAAAPNPAETTWALGDGGATWDGRVAAGFDLDAVASLFNGGAPVAYDGDAALDCFVWRGGAEAPVLTPAASVVSPPSNRVSVRIPAAATANLDPGTYRLQLGAAAGGVRRLLSDGTIEVAGAPGVATYRTPYVTRDDLLYWYDQLETLQTIQGGDAGFLRQRAESSDEFDRALVVRYDPRPGFVKTRRAAFDAGVLGFDVPDPSATPPSPAQLSAMVRAGGVIPDRNVREMVSKMAIARVLDRQEVMGGRNPYREEAAAFRQEAMALWRTFDVQVDADLDGRADLLVGRDVILLPPGTSP